MVLDAVGGRAATEADPADVGGVDVARADVFADDRAVGYVAAALHPAQVRPVGVVIGGVKSGGSLKQG